MIKKKRQSDGSTRVTFAVYDERPVSVVGDFNDWDPNSHPMLKRSNGTRSVAINVSEGSSVCFRYLADGGDFYDDPEADSMEPNGMGGMHCVVGAA